MARADRWTRRERTDGFPEDDVVVTILVTDDEAKLAEFEDGGIDPSGDGPLLAMSHEDWDRLRKAAAATGQTPQSLLKKRLLGVGDN